MLRASPFLPAQRDSTIDSRNSVPVTTSPTLTTLEPLVTCRPNAPVVGSSHPLLISVNDSDRAATAQLLHTRHEIAVW